MRDPNGDLTQRIARIRDRYPRSEPAMVAEVVRCVLDTMRGDLSGREAGLLAEVEELGRVISAARAEIAALQVDDITASHIPSATDELDAIVEHTAAATESILEACESLDRLGQQLNGSMAETLQDATTRIYEACSFQDITGQRITKIVATLKTIDVKIAQIVEAFGQRGGGAAELPGVEPPPAPAPEPESGPLLHVPQLPANAMDQSDIDRLLASFD